MYKSMKQPMDLQVISVIDVINDGMDNSMKVDFVSEPLAGVLWKLESEEIKEYDEVIASLKGIGSYTKNSCKWILT